MTRRGKNNEAGEVWQGVVREDPDWLRALVERVVQQVLEAELSDFLQAGPYERTAERRGYRNGYKPRLLRTRVGTLELLVPKDREGQFQTELYERYQRSEKALLLAIVQMYVEGVSTRKVRQITEALCGLEISKSQVSRLAKNLDEEMQSWRQRWLEQRYPYLVVDARYERVRRGGEVVSQGVLLVVGISEQGHREVLGVWLADSENEASWAEVFAELRRRGLEGVRYVVSDDHQGLVKAIARHFQGVVWQRCQVHFVRNVLHQVRVKDRGSVLRLLKAITEAPSLALARDALQETGIALRPKYRRLAEMLEEHGEDDAGRLPVAGGPPQADVLNEPVGAIEPGNQASHEGGPNLPRRGLLLAPGLCPGDGEKRGVDGAVVLGDGRDDTYRGGCDRSGLSC